MTTPDRTPKQKMVDYLNRHRVWAGFDFEPNPAAGEGYYTISRGRTAGTPGGFDRAFVHVAIDGSIRYSDSARFGQFFSWGMSG